MNDTEAQNANNSEKIPMDEEWKQEVEYNTESLKKYMDLAKKYDKLDDKGRDELIKSIEEQGGKEALQEFREACDLLDDRQYTSPFNANAPKIR